MKKTRRLVMSRRGRWNLRVWMWKLRTRIAIDKVANWLFGDPWSVGRVPRT